MQPVCLCDTLFTARRQTSERREGFTGREETPEELADENIIRATAAKKRKAAPSKE